MFCSLRGSCSSLAIVIALTGFGAAQASAQDQPDPASGDPAVAAEAQDDPAVIVVSGIRESIESSIDEKRRADTIKDTITAEDIGQLANENISEALQRIAGVQVTRSDDGEGQAVQIRGLSDNNVQINGETVSGTAADRGVNFQDLPPELFSGVEILKAQTADSIEGSLGGTINLKTRAPLSGRKDLIVNLNATQKFADVGGLSNQDANLLVIKQWRDTGIGDFGILLNFGYKETASVAEVYGGGDFDDAPAIWIAVPAIRFRRTIPISATTSSTSSTSPLFPVSPIPIVTILTRIRTVTGSAMSAMSIIFRGSSGSHEESVTTQRSRSTVRCNGGQAMRSTFVSIRSSPISRKTLSAQTTRSISTFRVPAR